MSRRWPTERDVVKGVGALYERTRLTWWSHRVGALERNRGLRVDHHLVHPSLRTRIQSVDIDVDERKRPNASDHTPVTLTLKTGT